MGKKEVKNRMQLKIKLLSCIFIRSILYFGTLVPAAEKNENIGITIQQLHANQNEK